MNADAAATRQRILMIASEMFSARGGQASLREISREVGLSLSTVHHYFGSKEGLYQACIDEMYRDLEGLRRELETSLLTAGGSQDVLGRVVTAGFRFARNHQPALRLLMREIIDNGEMHPDRRARYMVPFLTQAAGTLAMLLGKPVPQVRMALQSVVHLVVRYALTSSRELALVCSISDAATDADLTPSQAEALEDPAVEAVTTHLVEITRTLLGQQVN